MRRTLLGWARSMARWVPFICGLIVVTGFPALAGAQPLAQATELGREVTVASAVAEDSLAGNPAPSGWVYLLVELGIRNAGDAPINVAVQLRILDSGSQPARAFRPPSGIAAPRAFRRRRR